MGDLLGGQLGAGLVEKQAQAIPFLGPLARGALDLAGTGCDVECAPEKAALVEVGTGVLRRRLEGVDGREGMRQCQFLVHIAEADALEASVGHCGPPLQPLPGGEVPVPLTRPPPPKEEGEGEGERPEGVGAEVDDHEGDAEDEEEGVTRPTPVGLEPWRVGGTEASRIGVGSDPPARDDFGEKDHEPQHGQEVVHCAPPFRGLGTLTQICVDRFP